jgi:hypothetical protein
MEVEPSGDCVQAEELRSFTTSGVLPWSHAHFQFPPSGLAFI